MKKSKFAFLNPKIKDHNTKNSVLLYTMLVILVLMFVLVTAILKATRDEMRVETKARQTESNASLMNMIRQAVDNLYQPALIEPKEQRQYVYEMQVRFPINSENDRILAGAGSSSGNSVEYATVTSPLLKATAGSVLNVPADDSVAGLLSTVPMFQKCNRPFLIQYEAAPLEFADEFTLAGAKPLANGKTLYVFRSNACTSKYFVDSHTQAEMDRLQAQLLQAESY